MKNIINVRLNNPDEAINNLSEALKLYQMKRGYGDAVVGEILFHLGRVYGKRGDFSKSLSCCQESLTIKKATSPLDSENAADIERLVNAIKNRISMEKSVEG
jgi:tetratricopeptide (TPR) repeat protein